MKEPTTAIEIQFSNINGSPPSPSPSPSSSSSSSSIPHPQNPNPNPNPNPNQNPQNPNSTQPTNSMQSWWESISRARASIQTLSTILDPSSSPLFAALADSDRPARALLDSPDAASSISSSLSSSPLSGSGSDPLCHWLYDTLLSPDPDLRLVPVSFLPLLCGLYLSRLSSSPYSSLSGFEAVLLSVYSDCRSRSPSSKPLPLVSVPDLSVPSLYHSPRFPSPNSSTNSSSSSLSAPLEPLSAVKSTKRALVVAVALDHFFSKISLMPPRSKLDMCEFASAWAGQPCSCPDHLDRPQDADHITSYFSSEFTQSRDLGDGDEINHVEEETGRLTISAESPKSANEHAIGPSSGARVPLPWELFQPVLRIVGHCLLAPLNPPEVKDAASVAVRRLYARAMHDLLPQAILATRSLIQLDRRSRQAAKAAASAAASNANTPMKPKKPEILLVSK